MRAAARRPGALALCLLLAACGGDRRSAWAVADSVDIAAAVPAAPARTKPTDAEIAQIAGALNAVAERAAEHARTRVRSAEVASFAATLAADHRAMATGVQAFARDTTGARAEHPLAREVRTAGTAALEALGAASGTTYESAYIEDQITFHERALGIIDDVLLPSASSEPLRAFISGTRPAFAAHLQRALQIRQLIAAGATTVDSTTLRR